MASQKTWTSYVQVRNSQLCVYSLPLEGFEQPTWRKPPTRKGYSGEVTQSAAKRIRTAVDIFLQKSDVRFIYNPVTKRRQKFQLSFITLTVSKNDRIDTKDGHLALKVWLQHFKKPWNKRRMSEPIKSYIWKCELQERNQIHYHITTNSFLHLAEIRRVWNDLQKNRGWLDDYYSKYGKWDANSTDVHSIYKIKDVGRYLSKYIAKTQFVACPASPESGFPPLLVPANIGGKVWGCSEDLKGAKMFSKVMDDLTWTTIADAYGNGSITVHNLDKCQFIEHPTPSNLLSPSLFNDYNLWKK